MIISNRTWGIAALAMFLLLLVGIGSLTVVIDPYFHYHKPLESLQYRIHDERYQNDGIVKHFDYDAIITGNSMTENFKTSEFDQLFGVRSIKVAFSGAGPKEVDENLRQALAANPNIKMILRGMDYMQIRVPPDSARYEEHMYPRYLYDNKRYNDVKYVFNKNVLFDETLFTLSYTKNGGVTTTFDAYSNWSAGRTFGKEAVLSTYDWAAEAAGTQLPFTEEDRQMVFENITQNVTNLAEQYPHVEFYLFLTPYSVCYFDRINSFGTMNRQLESEKYAIELLLQHENIHLFSYLAEFDLVTDLDNYIDFQHYGEHVNSQILLWMKEGYGELTLENYEAYCEQVREFYTNYDYSTLTLD